MASHLQSFLEAFDCVKDSIPKCSIKSLRKYPKSRSNNSVRMERKVAISEIKQEFPQFEQLYADYYEVRDFHSLELLKSYIDSVISADCTKDRLVIMRALQVIGECLKNSLETPKLSDDTRKRLVKYLQRDTHDVLEKLRDKFSKEESLIQRDVVSEYSESFFVNVQTDIAKIRTAITEMLIRHKSKALERLFIEITESETMDNLRSCLGMFHFSRPSSLIQKKTEEFQIKNIFRYHFDNLEAMVKDCRKLVTKSDDVDALFTEITALMNALRFENETLLNTFCSDLELLDDIIFKFHNNLCSDEKALFTIKHFFMNVMRKKQSVHFQQTQFKLIPIMKQIERAANTLEDMDREKVFKSCNPIFQTFFELNKVKWIRELKRTVTTERKRRRLSESRRQSLFSSKLNSLKEFFKRNKLFDGTVPFEIKSKMHIELEMLVLDIMSILSEHHFTDNPFFLDAIYPVAIGKNMRNHLAHGNVLYTTFLPADHVQVLNNARKILDTVTAITVVEKIDKVVQCDIPALKDTHKLNLSIVRTQSEFYSAIQRGNLADVKALIRKGADINGRSLKLWTSLHFAASNSNVEVIRYLCSKNVRSNAKDINGRSPLHIAAAYGRANAVEYLLKELKMSVDDIDINGQTPLHVAAQNGHVGAIEVLVRHSARTTLKDKILFMTPIHHAFFNNHIEASKTLLSYVDDLNLEVGGGHTLLHLVAEKGHLELVEMLLKHVGLEARTDQGVTPLHLAASNGCSKVVQALMKSRGNANADLIDYIEALHGAVANGHADTAKLLLDSGGDVNYGVGQTTTRGNLAQECPKIADCLLKEETRGRHFQVLGRTPLHFAAKGGNVECVRLLIQHHAIIDATDANNDTPLHLSAAYANKDVVKLLIDQGASVNCINAYKETPLHLATSSGCIDAVQILLDKEADANAKDVSGNTALHLCVFHEHQGIAKVLLSRGADISIKNNNDMTPLELAVGDNMTECFINEGVVVRSVLQEAKTALHLGATSGNAKFVDYCIKNECDVDGRDEYGLTALHVAAQVDQKEIITLLLDNGSELELTDYKDRTALDFAVSHGNKDAVKYLIERGAKIRRKSLHLAVIFDQADIVELLFQRDFNLDDEPQFSHELLESAIRNGNRDICEILLMKGASKEAKTPLEGYTALHFAVFEGYRDIVKLLLLSNFDPFVAANDGDTPFHSAVRKGNTDLISIILKHISNQLIDYNWLKSALELAVHVNKLEALKVLMDTNINTFREYASSLLHIASQDGHLEIAKYLISTFADVHREDSVGRQPIHVASLNGHTEIVEYMLEKGLRVGDLGVNQKTLLHYAAEGGHSDTVKRMVKKGICINCVGTSGETPLHMAAQEGHEEAIRTLLELGAFYNIPNKSGKTPLEQASSAETVAILKSIENMFEAVKEGDARLVEKITRRHPFPNAKDRDDMTPLLYAASKGFSDVVDVLLSVGADPNLCGKHGLVALHYAAQLPNGYSIVKSLLSKCAVYDCASEDGRTPLDLSSSGNNFLKTVDQVFGNVQRGPNYESNVLGCLNGLLHDELRAVARARNNEGKTFVAVALNSGFSRIDDMKLILLKTPSDEWDRIRKLFSQGNYREFYSSMNEILKKSTDFLCSENPFVLDLRQYLISIKMREFRSKEALHSLKNIYKIRKRTLDVGHFSCLVTKFWIGVAQELEGNTTEAIRVLEKVYRKQKILPENKSLPILQTEAFLVQMKSKRNPSEASLNLLKRFYRETQKSLPDSIWLHLGLQCSIAEVCSDLGKQKESMKWFESTYNFSLQTFGEKHFMPLEILEKTATALCHHEKWDEALQVGKKILHAQKETLGPSHPSTLHTQYNLANMFFCESKLLGALIIYREGFEERKRILGPDHPLILDTLQKLNYIEYYFNNMGEESQWLLKHINNIFA